jgi:hypothetical protein
MLGEKNRKKSVSFSNPTEQLVSEEKKKTVANLIISEHSESSDGSSNHSRSTSASSHSSALIIADEEKNVKNTKEIEPTRNEKDGKIIIKESEKKFENKKWEKFFKNYLPITNDEQKKLWMENFKYSGKAKSWVKKLFVAIKKNRFNLVKKIVDDLKNKKIEAKNITNGITTDGLLHSAVVSNLKTIEIIEFLIKEVGCDVNATNKYDQTPLHMLAYRIVKLEEEGGYNEEEKYWNVMEWIIENCNGLKFDAKENFLGEETEVADIFAPHDDLAKRFDDLCKTATEKKNLKLTGQQEQSPKSAPVN